MCHSTTTLKRYTCATNTQELPHYRVLPLGGFGTLREVGTLQEVGTLREVDVIRN